MPAWSGTNSGSSSSHTKSSETWRTICGCGRRPSGDRQEGSILVPCLFMMSLLAMLSLGVLRVGGIGNTVSSTLADRSQAHLAALSGVQIAYGKLAVDKEYDGEECSPFDDSTSAVDIDVTDLGDSEFEILARGTMGGAESLVRTRARVAPFFLNYPLTVGNSVILKGTSRILGECYVRDVLWGKETSEITGNVHAMGERNVQYNVQGEPISIDGYPLPQIGGSIFTNAPMMDFPDVVLSGLREIADASGQVYSGTKHFRDEHLTGVIYIEGQNSRPFFKDVTIEGLLVCDDVPEIRIEKGFFKIHCDDDICQNVSILAPQSTLWVDPNALIDVYGLALFRSTDFQGSGTFTGPLVVSHDLLTLPGSRLYCQFPSFMKEFISTDLLWSEFMVVEMEYEEL